MPFRPLGFFPQFLRPHIPLGRDLLPRALQRAREVRGAAAALQVPEGVLQALERQLHLTAPPALPASHRVTEILKIR